MIIFVGYLNVKKKGVVSMCSYDCKFIKKIDPLKKFD